LEIVFAFDGDSTISSFIYIVLCVSIA
jgi:hypothetical protein